MLRIGFLPSDFNPMVLILGEAEDLHRLAGILRRFARDRSDTRIGAAPITLTGTAGPLGIQSAVEPGSFLWRLDTERAAAFADQVDALAQPSRSAGSEMLECATGEEIPVKVSRGEYTDDFLLGESA